MGMIIPYVVENRKCLKPPTIYRIMLQTCYRLPIEFDDFPIQRLVIFHKDRKKLPEAAECHGYCSDYPLVICYMFAIENGPVEIVDLPSQKMVDLSSSLCNKLPEGFLQDKSHGNMEILGFNYGFIATHEQHGDFPISFLIVKTSLTASWMIMFDKLSQQTHVS